jgi:hypothetical protein
MAEKVNEFAEIGVSGDKYSTGYNQDEFLKDLRGSNGVKKFREMRDNDSIVGAIMLGMEMLMRDAEYMIEPVDDSAPAEAEKEFVESLFTDMSHTFDDFMSEVVSYLTYGYHFAETVYKRRLGENKDPSKRSKYTDGRIGIRKLASRAQWTLDHFKIADDGGIQSFVQNPMAGHAQAIIPMQKGLLFRTTTLNNSPYGRSILRNCYVNYHYVTNIENIESIAIERELAGMPVARIPAKYLRSDATAEDKAFLAELNKIMRDIKFNEQAYMILPSDTYVDAMGKMTSIKQVEFELVSGSGSRAIDTGSVITRHYQNMTRSVLADFIMLGNGDGGSFALSKNKSDLFLKSLMAYLNNIEEIINDILLNRIWSLNGLNIDLKPNFKFGEVAPVDLEEFAGFIERMANSGMPLFPDEDLESHVREVSGLPERSDEAALLAQSMFNNSEPDDEPDTES